MEFPRLRFRGTHAIILVFIFTLVVFGGAFVPQIYDRAQSRLALLESVFGPDKQSPLVLSDEELANLTQPAIVRIYAHVSGTISIPGFDIDLKTLDIALTAKVAPTDTPLNDYVQGSGFVVSPDGYLLTNAHVVDVGELKNEIVGSAVGLKFLDGILKLKPAEQQQVQDAWQKIGISALDQTQAVNLLQKKIDQELIPYVTSTVTSDLRVVDPSAQYVNASTSFDNARRASIVSFHKNYIEDKQDVALIKIEAANLPALSLDAAALESNISPTQGTAVYAFGFPASADAISGPIDKATFTPGSVTAVKTVSAGGFDAIETNAKVSQGSSGSPLLDKNGNVIGIVTFESGLTASGDNFAFAIPISLAKEMLAQANVANGAGAFNSHFLAGLAYAHADHCAQATAEFKAASAANMFGEAAAVQPSIDKCASLIAAGNSIDSTWDALRIAIRDAGVAVWGIVAGAALLIAIAAFFIIRMRRKMKKEEEAIAALESQERNLESQFGAPAGTSAAKGQPVADAVLRGGQLPIARTDIAVPSEQAPDSSRNGRSSDPLAIYISQAKTAGQTDEQILEELKAAGWPEEKILEALTRFIVK